ncbi:MAG: flagellar basal body P-ring formation chaperone FlgA [Rhodospirillaceae bacterium]
MGKLVRMNLVNLPFGFRRTVGSFALSLAVMLAASPLAAATTVDGKTGGSANTLDENLRLNTAITVQADVVTLGDVFQGYLSRPEKVVAQAPRPGQRMTLSAEWLEDTARTYGLDWRPTNTFDRAVVYQPGQTVNGAEILAQVKAALIANGMPENYGVTATTTISPITVAMKASTEADVREAVYNESNRTFSALVQIPRNDPQAIFIQLRGTAFPTVQLPVLKMAAGKNTAITADMIDIIDVAEDQVRPETLTDPNQLIGKNPKMFLKAGQPIRENDVAQITMVDVPVLITATDRDTRIAKADVKVVSMNAASLPADAVTDAAFLVGKTPRRNLVAGTPIRRADVTVVKQIEIPVLARDVARGTELTADDITYVMMNEGDVMGDVVTDEAGIVGQTARLMLRAGQPLRKYSMTKPIAVERNQMVTVMWTVKSMNLTAQAKTMERGAVGEMIRVTNTKSNQTVLAEIIDSRTVRVAAPDQVYSR